MIELINGENEIDQEDIAFDKALNLDGEKRRKKVKQIKTAVAFFLRGADKTGIFLTKAEEAAYTRIVQGNYYLILRTIISSPLDNEAMRQLKEAALIRRKKILERNEKISKKKIMFFVRGIRGLLFKPDKENNDEELNAIKSLAAKVEKMAEEIRKVEETMVKKNMLLVVSIAYKYYGRLPLDDLLQEGSMGLMAAIYKHDYLKGNFSTYASWWIRQAMVRAIVDKGNTIRIPIHITEDIIKLNRTAKELTRAGELADQGDKIELLADKTGFTTTKVIELLEMQQPITSLECPIKGEESDTTIANIIENKQNVPVDLQILQKERVALVKQVLSTLSYREKAVIRMSFGFDETPEHSLAEIGKEFNISRERARQIKEKALNRLRHPTRFNKLKQV